MTTVYKLFLILFIVFTGFNFYAIDWSLGFLHQDNTKYLVSISAAIIGILLVFVLNTWSKITVKK